MLNTSIPRIVVSGLRGGGGKTILSLSLVAFLKRRGVEIITFKKGPDYIDAGWLARASGAPCYNLDLFIMSPEEALYSFISRTASLSSPAQRGRGGFMAMIEGNRGLYDGVDHQGTYSTAELAKLLRAPVIITVDCTKATNTVAAMILGCQRMDPGVAVKGVVLNRVATRRQESVIRRAVNERCGLPVLGAIPRLRKNPIPERHMGLIPFQEHGNIEESMDILAETGSQYLDTDAILEIAASAGTLKAGAGRRTAAARDASRAPGPGPRIGVIRDSAFQFYYQENFEEIQRLGASIVEVSPLNEDRLPDLDALYIGGGFPETHAIALADNAGFRDSLYNAIQEGFPVYAECGGLMYLGKRLVLDGSTYPMVGALPVTFGLQKRPLAHGYTIVEVERENPYFQRRKLFKGHEFHYSKVLEIDEDGVYMAFKMRRGKGIVDNRDGMCYKNVFAAYTHLHAVGTPEWAAGVVRCALEYNRQKPVKEVER